MRKIEFNLGEEKIGELIERRYPSFLENLDDDDAFSRFEDYSGSTFIADGISEIADSCVNTYTKDLWKAAQVNQEYIEDAIAQGIAPVNGKDIDLEGIFRAGEYVYYTNCLYDNLEDLAFNYALEKLDDYDVTLLTPLPKEEKLDAVLVSEAMENLSSKIEEALDGEASNISNNNTFEDIEECALNAVVAAIIDFNGEMKDQGIEVRLVCSEDFDEDEDYFAEESEEE